MRRTRNGSDRVSVDLQGLKRNEVADLGGDGIRDGGIGEVSVTSERKEGRGSVASSRRARGHGWTNNWITRPVESHVIPPQLHTSPSVVANQADFCWLSAPPKSAIDPLTLVPSLFVFTPS